MRVHVPNRVAGHEGERVGTGRTARGWRGGEGRGQSMIELALLMPVLCFLLLAVVDLARAYSVAQRLEQGAHLASSKLLATPTLPLVAAVAAEAGLPPSAVTATASYSADPNGNNHVTITAAYPYPLLLPGLRALQLGALSNGTVRIAVQAAGLARTDPPTIASDLTLSDCALTAAAGVYCLQIAPLPAGTGATPAGLVGLVCTVYKNGTPLALQPSCANGTPLRYGATGVTATDHFTATVTQADGVVSVPGTWP